MFGIFNKWRKLARHLEKNGERAPATVVEIAQFGTEVKSQGYDVDDALTDMKAPGTTLAPNSAGYMVRKARLRVRPADEPEFEVERKMRFGDWGRYVPKAGEEIEVIYDPADHEKVMVAPPTPEEEAVRTANALSKADIGFAVGTGGHKPGKTITEEELEERTESMGQQMDQAQEMLEQAQEFMSGKRKPGSSK